MKNLGFILMLFAVCIRFTVRCQEANWHFTSTQDSKLPKFICDVVRDTIRKDREVSTVSMAIFEHNFDASLIDKTLQCIPKRLSVTVNDYRIEQHKPELYGSKASIVIMIADHIDVVRKLYSLFKIILIMYLISTAQIQQNHIRTAVNIRSTSHGKVPYHHLKQRQPSWTNRIDILSSSWHHQYWSGIWEGWWRLCGNFKPFYKLNCHLKWNITDC